MKKYFINLFFLFLVACSTSTPQVTVTSEVTVTSLPAITSTPEPALWISNSVPDDLRDLTKTWNIKIVDDKNVATQILDVSDSGATWIYALVASFPTLTDDTASSDLISIWKGDSTEHTLIMAESTLSAFKAQWGEPSSSQVRSVASEQIVDEVWKDSSTWAIIPFEEIQPKLKVISVDGQSPLHKDFDESLYSLKIIFGGVSFDLPTSNRDATKLTTVVLTGVTALVRATAFTMETKGVTRPGELIHDWLYDADIAHISNEVPFDKNCPYPTAGHKKFYFVQ
ncbi:MAG: hypothetical protein UZ14_CFX002001738 [Chloroflexi bacterium OLB14]|nr:MAG: hypothetical protein UZ14_CFX002001738 [Chloroflexi bacterium OLB14]